MGQSTPIKPRTLHIATTADGSYMEFFTARDARIAVAQFAARRGLMHCRWTRRGKLLDLDGRKLGATGTKPGNPERGPGVVAVRTLHEASRVAATA